MVWGWIASIFWVIVPTHLPCLKGDEDVPG